MTRPTERECTYTWMEQNTKVTGVRTSSTATELRLGLTLPSTRETTSMERSMEAAHLSGLMDPCTWENSTTIKSMAKESTLGVTDENMKESGGTIKCTAKEVSCGLTTESTSETTTTTKSRATENSSGLMEGATKETGTTGSSTARVFISPRTRSRSTVSGKRAVELDGLARMRMPKIKVKVEINRRKLVL